MPCVFVLGIFVFVVRVTGKIKQQRKTSTRKCHNPNEAFQYSLVARPQFTALPKLCFAITVMDIPQWRMLSEFNLHSLGLERRVIVKLGQNLLSPKSESSKKTHGAILNYSANYKMSELFLVLQQDSTFVFEFTCFLLGYLQ